MFALSPAEHEALRRLARSGTQDVADVGLSVAIRLQLAGCATITAGDPQRVAVTAMGAAHSRRQVWA